MCRGPSFEFSCCSGSSEGVQQVLIQLYAVDVIFFLAAVYDGTVFFLFHLNIVCKY